jgi:hypothetical protein
MDDARRALAELSVPHLYRIFPKLRITSRGQLRDALDTALA